MPDEKNRGFFKEFKRTPQEQKQVDLWRKVIKLEKIVEDLVLRVKTLEEEVRSIRNGGNSNE